MITPEAMMRAALLLGGLVHAVAGLRSPAAAAPAAAAPAQVGLRPSCAGAARGQQRCWPQWATSGVFSPVKSDDPTASLPRDRSRGGPAGVWVQHGSTQDLLKQTFVKGGDVTIAWKDVEVAKDVWNWTAMDEGFAAQAAAGFYIETSLQAGPMAPTWLYDDVDNGGAGLTPTLVVMSNHTGIRGQCIQNATYPSHLCTFPTYLDQRYQTYFLRAVERFAQHIATLPHSVRSKIIASQAEYGTTGDDSPWHGEPADPKQNICFRPDSPGYTKPCKRVGQFADEWHNFTMSTAPAICASYRRVGIKGTRTLAASRSCVRNALAASSRQVWVSHGFSVNGEADNYHGKGKICHTEGYRCRGESWAFCKNGYYLEAPLWATYSHLLWQLTFGVDLPGLSEPNLLNESYAPLYELFNRYAGSIRPPADDWVGGIIALRDGLDAANFSRFPESQFGAWGSQKESVARLRAIAAAFAKRGAVERDPEAAVGAAMESRHRTGTNDVGFRIWQGNYGNGLVTQLQPFLTSVGWWGVGPQDQPYGRYARGFEPTTGRTDMAFVLDTRLWGGLPLSVKNSLTLAVTYLDGEDGFDIFLDSASGCNVPTRSISGTSTGRWITATLTVTDGYFGLRCESKAGAADIVLRSTKGSSTGAIVHGLEIYDPSKLP